MRRKFSDWLTVLGIDGAVILLTLVAAFMLTLAAIIEAFG